MVEFIIQLQFSWGGNINTIVFDNFSGGPARNRTIDGATIDGDPKEIHWKGNSIPIC